MKWLPFFIIIFALLSCSEFKPEDWSTVLGEAEISSSSVFSSSSFTQSGQDLSSSNMPKESSSSVNDSGSSSSATDNRSSSAVTSSSSSGTPGSSSSVFTSSSSSQPEQSSGSSVLSSSSLALSSSSVASSSSSSVFDCSDFKLKYYMLQPNVTQDSCQDIRGNQNETYKIVKITDQIWMAENLNYIPDNIGSAAKNSWCHKRDELNCDTYGRLYDWATTMKLPQECNNLQNNCTQSPQHQGLCPEGWHISTEEEWISLKNAAQNLASSLKAKTWRGGTDRFGFSALPGGTLYNNQNFSHLGDIGYWWFAQTTKKGFISMNSNDNDITFRIIDTFQLISGFSVRCVMD